jgi:DNA repair protein RadC
MRRPRFQREYPNQKQPASTGGRQKENPMEQIHLFKKEIQRKYQPKEWKVVALRECPTPDRLQMCDTPDKAAEYWQMHVATSPQFNPECECLVVIFLNTRRKVKGHQFVTIGTMDTLLVHPREIFRTAIVASSSAILVMHNHPSGEPQPSEADIKVTRDLIRAGELLKIEVIDHVIVGHPNHSSLRGLGYFL